MPRPLAVVTGASTGIGFELARCAAADGFDLILVADEAEIAEAAARLGPTGAQVETVMADLATPEGIDAVAQAVGGRPVDVLVANAGRGVAGPFLDHGIEEQLGVIALNVSGTVALTHRLGRPMRERKAGRILVTGSIAAFAPAGGQAVYAASKAFLHSFAGALGAELSKSGVSVTVLAPGLTDTAFFERGDMEELRLAQAPKADPATVAQDGWRAMMDGRETVVSGLANKAAAALSGLLPERLVAGMALNAAEPAEGEDPASGSNGRDR